MFGTKPDPDETGRNAPQEGKPDQEAQWPWSIQRTRLPQDRLDDTILNDQLQALRHPGRPITSLLHLPELVKRHSPFAQRRGQKIRCRHGILNREVDPDTSDGRHGMRRVTDAEQPRPRPMLQPIHLHGEQSDRLPAL